MVAPRLPSICAPPELNAFNTRTAGAWLRAPSPVSSARTWKRKSLNSDLRIDPAVDARSSHSLRASGGRRDR